MATAEDNFKAIGYKKYLLQMFKKGEPTFKVIALFAILRGLKFETYQQLQFFITRNVRPAKRLSAFPNKRIKEVYDYCVQEFGKKFKIGLETIEKYILEDLDSLNNE